MPLETLITGRIATLAGDSGFGWVEAIGIRDGRIAFAGSEVDLETRADPFTERIRLGADQVAIPGLTDAHLHLAQAAMALMRARPSPMVGAVARSTCSAASAAPARWRWASVSAGMAISPGSSSTRRVCGSARVSSSTADPANATLPPRIPIASTQP